MVILVFILMVAAVGLLRIAWEASFAKPWLLILASFVCFLLAIYLASQLVGLEFGVTYLVLFTAPIALLCLLFDWQRKVDRKGEQREIQKLSLNKKKSLQNIGHFTVVIPLFFIMSMLSIAHLANFVTNSVANAAATMLILVPLLWATLAYIYFVIESKKIVISVCFVTTLSLAGITYLV